MSADDEIAILNVNGSFYIVKHQISFYVSDLESDEDILQAFEGGHFFMDQQLAYNKARNLYDERGIVGRGVTTYRI